MVQFLSMKKIRINELARELEVKPNRILELLPELGVQEKKTHSSSIDEDVAVIVKDRLAGKGGPSEYEDESDEDTRHAAHQSAGPRPARPPAAAQHLHSGAKCSDFPARTSDSGSAAADASGYLSGSARVRCRARAAKAGPCASHTSSGGPPNAGRSEYCCAAIGTLVPPPWSPAGRAPYKHASPTPDVGRSARRPPPCDS